MRATISLSALAILVLSIAASVASAGGATGREGVRLRLVPTDSFYVDNDPSGNSGGDLYGSSGDLRHRGEDVGSYDSACTAFSAVGAQCQATLIWRGRGRIQLAGTFRLDRPDNVISIVGGTREFRRASGAAHIAAVNQGQAQRVRLRIIK